MGKISQLESKLQNLIAAGEVIESIANVVKELIENALDAGASQIDITLEEAGMKRIHIVDNGSGMDSTDAKMAFLRHATSKIRTEYDLFHINSLGFRGEALPSIAAVSRVELITSEGENAGTRVIVEDNIIQLIEPIGFRKGTSVDVTRLFYHTPVRFKYLKSVKHELQKSVDLVGKFALANPEVAFTLSNNNRKLLTTYGKGNELDVIAGIYGTATAKEMVLFEVKGRDYHVHGHLSRPLETRSSKRDIHLFVNRRPIHDSQLQNTVIEAYGQRLPVKRYPIVVLKIEVDPQLIDVNVHPAKHQVKFSEYDSLKSIVYKCIQDTLRGKPVIEKFVVADAENNVHQRPNSFEASDTVYEKPSLFDYNNGSIDLQVYSSLEYIGQYHGAYLLFQNEDGLFLMDQHAAAERIRYERYRKKMGEPVVGVYRLLVPIPLRGSVADKTLIDDQACDKLASLGVSLQAKELHYEIVEVPNWFPRGHEAEFVETILISISENRQASAAELLDDLAILLSCKHSLKANKYVDPRSAGVLLRDLSQCENPYTCPHGRPIFVNLSHADIEKLFKRT